MSVRLLTLEGGISVAWRGQTSINTEQLFLLPVRAEFLDWTEAGEEEQNLSPLWHKDYVRVSIFKKEQTQKQLWKEKSPFRKSHVHLQGKSPFRGCLPVHVRKRG